MLFELDKYERRLHQQPPAKPVRPYEPVRNIEKASLLYWAEHCVECAAPSCYKSCDLYQPRTDTRCRRFTFGAFKNHSFRSVRGYGVEISFKKWAKMMAFGNMALLSRRQILWSEKIVEWYAPVANVFGKFMARATGKARWKAAAHEGLEELVRRMNRKRSMSEIPDAFLLEVYNPGDEIVRMQLSFLPVPTPTDQKDGLVQLSRGFHTTVEFRPGYSRHEVTMNFLRTLVESGDPFDITLNPEEGENARLVFLTSEFVKYTKQPESTATRAVKCVVFDLDNTIWDGVLVEGDDVALRPGIAALLRRLDERGILLCIASKNDSEAALRKLEELGLADYFLYPQINWQPKSESIKVIAERLNIGIDTLAFIDDRAFELDEVARACPEVLCVNADQMEFLSSDERFQGSATPDARRRRLLYREAALREEVQESFGSNYEGFLAACDIHLELSEYSEEAAERIAELVQRTNQLNFSGQKYTRKQLQEILDDPLLEKYVLKSHDKYGSYGTVGFGIVQTAPDAIRVRDFMLSCRVQGKLLEKAFFDHLMRFHNPGHVPHLWVNFQQTARNTPALNVLESLGFHSGNIPVEEFSSGMMLATRDTLTCEFIGVECSCQGESGLPSVLSSQSLYDSRNSPETR